MHAELHSVRGAHAVKQLGYCTTAIAIRKGSRSKKPLLPLLPTFSTSLAISLDISRSSVSCSSSEPG
eukprot:3763768-Pleurochrysis_carterae.AAC.3